MHPDQLKWNQRYLDRGPEAFGRHPSDWLKAHGLLLEKLAPGPAIDLACGNGRNALFLAGLGFSVDAMDISDVAIEWLKKEATGQQLQVSAKMVDLTAVSLPSAHYRLIANFNYLERSLFPVIEKALAPGGLLFFETFTVDQIDLIGSEIPRRYTLEHNELLLTFSRLRILHYREGVFFEEGKQKNRAVASLVAQKKTDR